MFFQVILGNRYSSSPDKVKLIKAVSQGLTGNEIDVCVHLKWCLLKNIIQNTSWKIVVDGVSLNGMHAGISWTVSK